MDAFTGLKLRLQASCPDMELREDEPMSRHTSFRIGGPVRLMALPRSTEELASALAAACELDIAPVILGNGTNLLAADGTIERFAIKLTGGAGSLQAIERLEGDRLLAGAGISLARLASFAWRQGLTGLEFAHGIPGSLGGGAVMNAGAYDGELKNVILETSYLTADGRTGVLCGDEQAFGYRTSAFGTGNKIVTSCLLQLSKGEPAHIKARMDELMRKRRASQPLEWPSAGSTFKRPAGGYAAALIDQCGLKGASVGDAQVSEKHAGFVINRGSATCADVMALTDFIRETVLRETGIELELEIKRL